MWLDERGHERGLIYCGVVPVGKLTFFVKISMAHPIARDWDQCCMSLQKLIDRNSSSSFLSFELSKNLKLKVVKSIFISFFTMVHERLGQIYQAAEWFEQLIQYFSSLFYAYDTTNRTNLSQGKKHILSLVLVASSKKNSKSRPVTILMGRFQAH